MQLRRAMLSVASSAALLSACGEFSEDIQDTTTPTEGALTLAQRQAICDADIRVRTGVVSRDICTGAEIFLRETFNGNGRTCAACHAVTNNFTIDPAFIATLPANNPLFIAEQVPALANLERPAQMRQRSLILENVDGFGTDPNVRFVLRSTPHNLSMGVSVTTPAGQPNPPADRTGWSGDGAPGQGRLVDFTNGAIGQHFTTNLNRAQSAARAATEQEGQLVNLFMRELGRKNDINLGSATLSDAGADTGRQRFLAVGCNACHTNAGANSTIATGGNRNFNTGVESTRNSGLNAFPRDGGFGAVTLNADGSIGDGTFNSTPLIEAADTGPFFHTDTTVTGAVSNNTGTANTIEQATAFYSTPAFANRPGGGGVPLAINATDVTNIGRFLRAVNAIFNIQMASNRTIGARNMGNALGASLPNTTPNALAVAAMTTRLANLAIEELDDAVRVLQQAQGGALNSAAQTTLGQARGFLVNARDQNRGTATVPPTQAQFGLRMQALADAFNRLDIADDQISANVTFTIGNGTRMD